LLLDRDRAPAKGPASFILSDNEKNEVVDERLLQPPFCLRAGKRYDADASILPHAVAARAIGPSEPP
jgi:dihydroorotase